MKKTLVWTFIFTLIGAVIPICYSTSTAEHKELTIQEEREIDFLNKSNGDFTLICNDSVKLDNYNYIAEYSITNTGNATIIGFGPNSDLLTVDNTLCIASNSTIVKLYNNDDSVTLELEDGTKEIVAITDYEKQVYRFADMIENFYLSCSPKVMPKDPFDKNGYIAFWNEWHRRRGK
jgi:hypothetical protein